MVVVALAEVVAGGELAGGRIEVAMVVEGRIEVVMVVAEALVVVAEALVVVADWLTLDDAGAEETADVVVVVGLV